jgi:hypothetical protein
MENNNTSSEKEQTPVNNEEKTELSEHELDEQELDKVSGGGVSGVGSSSSSQTSGKLRGSTGLSPSSQNGA